MLAKSDAGEADRVLRTRRLVLAPLAPSHAPLLFGEMNDWDVISMLAELPWPLAADAVEAYSRRALQPDSGTDDFTVLLEGSPIGVLTVKLPGSGKPPRVMPRLGYWLGRAHWGRGYATEALAALVDDAFARHPQERIGAGVFTDNPASRRVLEKLGFQRAGGYALHCRARDASVDVDDMHLTQTDWAAGAGRA